MDAQGGDDSDLAPPGRNLSENAAACLQILIARRFRPGDSPTDTHGSDRILTGTPRCQALLFDRAYNPKAAFQTCSKKSSEPTPCPTRPHPRDMPRLAFVGSYNCARPRRLLTARLAIGLSLTSVRQAPNRLPIRQTPPQAGHHPAGDLSSRCCLGFCFRNPPLTCPFLNPGHNQQLSCSPRFRR